MNCKTCALVAVVAGSAVSVYAGTIHVAPCGDDTWTGASPVCAAPDGPKRTIQAAINVSVNGDIVLVADGTYKGAGNRDMDFGGRAITVRGNSTYPELCVIDCQASEFDRHRAFLFQSGETGASVLEGLTVQNGFSPLDYGTGQGGAVLSISSAPTIRNCTFQSNRARFGGAVLILGGGITLVDCTLRDNTADRAGGAVYSEIDGGRGVITGCTFLRNRTTDPDFDGGGGLRATLGEHTISNCRFIENETARFVGGLWVRLTRASVTNCTFVGNSAGQAGGMAVTYDAQATVANCLFTGNRNSVEGDAAALNIGDGFGGPVSATVVNCTFNQNASTPNDGAALRVEQTSNVSVANCILWGNTPAEVLTDPGTSVTLSYSDIQGGWTGAGSDNMDANPLFADPDAGDYSLSPFSPCLDSGDNTAVLPGVLTDLDENPRFRDDPWMADTGVPGGAGGSLIVDMGAYERQGPSCVVDLNGDGVVDFADYLEFLNLYDAGDLRADFNHDGIVDFSDYLEFLNLFDAGC